EALMECNLADELAYSSRGSGNKDNFTLLRLADFIERGVGGEAGHAEDTKEVVLWKVVGVVEWTDLGKSFLAGNDLILGGVGHARDDIAFLEARGIGLDDLGDGVVGDWL